MVTDTRVMSRTLRTAIDTAAGGQQRAVIYCRISQDRTGANLGVDRQREDCEALAKRNDWDVVEVYVDNDVSAFSGKLRKDYRRMLADLELGTATIVIAWHTDRLHRSPTELEEYIDLSERRGVSTHTCQAGSIDLSSPSGRMTARILGAVARQESEHKGDRVARARQQKAKAGQWAGGPRPFGWGLPTGEVTKKTAKGTGEEIEVPVLDMTKLVPEEGDALNVGTDMILSGGSIRGWVRWLAENGLRGTQGKPLNQRSARDLLIRPRNAGIAVYRGEEIGKGQWEPAVDEPRFRAVMAILTNPARVTTPGPTPKWFGSLIYECGFGDCTKTVICTRTGRGNYPSYRCPDQCGGGRKVDVVDRYVQDLIIERLSRDDAAELLQPAPNGVNVAALQLESEQIRRRLTDLAAMFGAGNVDMAQFTEGTDVARAQLAGITAQLARAAVKDPLVGLVGVPDVRKAWEGLGLDRRRTVLRTLLKVRLLKPRPGRRADGGYVDYDAIETKWRR